MYLPVVIRHVLRWFWVLPMGATLAAGAVRTEQSAPEIRQVLVRVMNEDGVPMPGVKVQLLGVGRDALQAMDIGASENLPGVWNFISDARGCCLARFGCFSGYDGGKRIGMEMPGWGQFYFVAEADGLRGVSSCLLHGAEAGGWANSGNDEWERRGIVRTRAKQVTLTLRMQRGLRVTGRVIDMAGQPVRGFTVGIQHDLHSTHHTGYGDEIFQDSRISDAEGRFSFDHVFPNTFYLGPMNEETRPVWVRTRVRGQWLREPVDFITPRRGEKEIRLTLMVSPEAPYRYFGRITDRAGRPIANAKLAFGISFHRQPRTFADTHHTDHTEAGEDGRYELRIVTPFISWLKVTAPGYADYAEDFADGHVKAAGRWDIVMRQ